MTVTHQMTKQKPVKQEIASTGSHKRGDRDYPLFERRRYTRIPTTLYVPYSFRDQVNEEHGVLASENVSGGGILFKGHRLFPMGAVLNLEIHMPTRFTPIAAEAKVIRVEKDPTGPEGRKTAIAFTKMKDTDRKELIRCLLANLLTVEESDLIA